MLPAAVGPPTVSSLLYIVPPCTREQSGTTIKNTECKHHTANSARKYQARVCVLLYTNSSASHKAGHRQGLASRRKHPAEIRQDTLIPAVCVCVQDTHPPLQTIPFPQCQCVSLGDNWHDVDFAVDGLHELHVQRLQTNSEGEEKTTG